MAFIVLKMDFVLSYSQNHGGTSQNYVKIGTSELGGGREMSRERSEVQKQKWMKSWMLQLEMSRRKCPFCVWECQTRTLSLANRTLTIFNWHKFIVLYLSHYNFLPKYDRKEIKLLLDLIKQNLSPNHEAIPKKKFHFLRRDSRGEREKPLKQVCNNCLRHPRRQQRRWQRWWMTPSGRSQNKVQIWGKYLLCWGGIQLKRNQMFSILKR